MKSKKTQQTIKLKALERFHKEGFDLYSEDVDVHKLIEELRIHQIELEIQNEELRQAQQRVSEVAEQYSDLYDFAPVGYLTLDRNTVIRRLNLTAATLLGTSREKLINKPLVTRIPITYHATLNLHVRSVLTQKIPPVCDLQLIRPDGTRLWVALSSSLEISSNHETLCRATLMDISERKRAEEEIHTFKMLAESATYGVLLANLEGTITYANAAFSALYGYRRDEIIGQKLTMLLPDGKCPLIYTTDSDSVHHDNTGAREMTQMHKDGTTFEALVNITLVRDETGAARFLAITVTDITELKSLEAQLLKAQKMEAIGQLAGGIAHDFNNLLTVIINRADFIQESLHRFSPSHDDLKEIIEASMRGATLIHQLLAYSRRQHLTMERLDLNGIVHDVEKILNRLIGEDIRLYITLNPTPCLTLGDPGQLEQVLINLAVNARDAMPNGGILAIETHHIRLGPEDINPSQEVDNLVPGDYVVLSVTDTGQGMDKAIQTQIFDPFFTTKDIGKGTGLGLSTVYGIVKQHNGFIHVYSELHKGTNFRILLPVRSTAHENGHRQLVQPRTLRLGHETILLAEDDQAVRRVSAKMLRDLGYQVLEAENGRNALEYVQFQGDSIALLLTDVVMPEMDGKQLAERMAALKPHIKVIFTSGYPEAQLKLQDAWMTDYLLLQKPFVLSELANSIRNTLDS